MNKALAIIGKFGGSSALARHLGHKNNTTVQGWGVSGTIPDKYHQEIWDLAARVGVDLDPLDFTGLRPPLSPESAEQAREATP